MRGGEGGEGVVVMMLMTMLTVTMVKMVMKMINWARRKGKPGIYSKMTSGFLGTGPTKVLCPCCKRLHAQMTSER